MGDLETGKLQERFEESAFAILMDAFAQAEGARLLAENKRLAIKPSELPAGMDDRITKVIDREYQKLRWKKAVRAGKRVLSRVAMIVLAITVLFSLLCVTSSAFRQRMLNLVTEWTEKYTSFQIVEEPQGSVPHEPYWLPEGYELVEEKSANGVFYYMNENGHRITYRTTDGKTIEYVDTENAVDIRDIKVNGYSGITCQKHHLTQVSFADTQENVIICFVSDVETEQTVIRIAESMYE